MPLKSGKSQTTKSKNIEELLKSFKKTGKIGTSKPKSMKAAKKQAAAIAYSKARGESSEETKNESYDSLVNKFLAKYLLEDALATVPSANPVNATKPANPNDPAVKKIQDLKKKKAQRELSTAGKIPTQGEADAFQSGFAAAKQV